MNGKLARADTLAFYSFGGGGMAPAYLLPVEGGRARDAAPVHSFLLGRGSAPALWLSHTG